MGKYREDGDMAKQEAKQAKHELTIVPVYPKVFTLTAPSSARAWRCVP